MDESSSGHSSYVCVLHEEGSNIGAFVRVLARTDRRDAGCYRIKHETFEARGEKKEEKLSEEDQKFFSKKSQKWNTKVLRWKEEKTRKKCVKLILMLLVQ